MAAMGSIGGGPLGQKPESLNNNTDANPNSKALLNTYIHNYFIGEGLIDLAKTLRGSRLPFKNDYLCKEDSADGDNKDDLTNRGDGGLGMNSQGGAGTENFLPNWWSIFWDMWSAARQKEKTDNAAAQYLAHTQRLRQQQQTAVLQQQAMIGSNFHRFNPMQQPQIADLQKRGMTANGRLPASMNNINRLQQMGQNPLQRDGSDLDMNGAPRGQSPMPGENNAPSPKRQKFDNGGFNPQMVPNGRPQGIGGQPPNGSAPNANMLMTTTFDPQNAMSPNFNQQNGLTKNPQQIYAQEMANQTKSAMHSIPKAAMAIQGMPANSPMITTGPDGQILPPDLFGQGPNAMRAGNMGASGNGGALADYQMQLMLLEQQNKKRLMMARQEQDVAQRDQGGVGPQGLMGQSGFAPPMSPHASRAGHSPPSNDPTKRAADKMGQDSPLPDTSMGPGRASPAQGTFEAGQMQNNLVPPFTMVGGAHGMMVRPNGQPGGPMPQHLEMMRQQGVRMGNGAWPQGMHNQGQMMQQVPGQMQPNQIDNNQRNNMPPPQGPPNGRTQPPSPQQTPAAPPTPSQPNKAGPKKKETKDKANKKTTKKAAATTGATPSEIEQADEVPPTPLIPHHPASSFIKGDPPNQKNQNPPAQPATSMPPSAMNMGAPQDNSMVAPFGSLSDGGDMTNFDNFDDILGQDNTDVLHGFDFDAFLHNEPVPGFDFDAPYLSGDNPLETMGE